MKVNGQFHAPGWYALDRSWVGPSAYLDAVIIGKNPIVALARK